MIDYLFLKCDDGRHARHEVQVVLERSSEVEHSCFLDLWLDANDCGLMYFLRIGYGSDVDHRADLEYAYLAFQDGKIYVQMLCLEDM